MVEMVELGRVMVIVRAQFEQVGQRREHEQQHFEQYLLGGARADQQRQQEHHLDLDQFDDQHQRHAAGQEFLLEQLLCAEEKPKPFFHVSNARPQREAAAKHLTSRHRRFCAFRFLTRMGSRHKRARRSRLI